MTVNGTAPDAHMCEGCVADVAVILHTAACVAGEPCGWVEDGAGTCDPSKPTGLEKPILMSGWLRSREVDAAAAILRDAADLWEKDGQGDKPTDVWLRDLAARINPTEGNPT